MTDDSPNTTPDDLDDLSEFAPVGDPEDGGIVYQPVDYRDFYNFADFAQSYFRYTQRGSENPGYRPPPPGTGGDLLKKVARRYAVQILGYDARGLTWHATPGDSPDTAYHNLADTDHRLLYRPSKPTGDYELVLERHCRFHPGPDYFILGSLAELGALLAGKDPQR